MLALHTDIQAQALTTRGTPHTQGHTHKAHTRKGALQEEAVQESLASYLEKLSAAPPVAGQLWAQGEPWPLHVCQERV